MAAATECTKPKTNSRDLLDSDSDEDDVVSQVSQVRLTGGSVDDAHNASLVT